MSWGKTVSVVVTIPAYNEAATVGQVIEAIPGDIPAVKSIDVVVINDGSTDGTAEVASQAGAKVVSFSHNRGLGAAFSEGFRTALGLGADIIVNIDADGQFNPQDIPRLIKPIIEAKADMVTASRFADPDLIPEMPWAKKWGNVVLPTLSTNLLTSNYTMFLAGSGRIVVMQLFAQPYSVAIPIRTRLYLTWLFVD